MFFWCVNYQYRDATFFLSRFAFELPACLLGMIKEVKVSHSLIAVGAVEASVPLYLGHS